MFNWIYKIRNFDKLKTAHENLKDDNRRQSDANQKKNLRIANLENELLKSRLEVKDLQLEIITVKFEALSEPKRIKGCDKPRIDGRTTAKNFAITKASSMKKSMGIYHCTVCPASPISNQRYYHLTTHTNGPDVIFVAEYRE